jgi:hypothetical protein
MKVMKFEFAASGGGHKARGFEDLKMLRDRLPRQPDLMLHRQA